MVKFDIEPKRTALLIIDMMNAFLRPGSPLEIPKGRQLIPELNRLIKLCREKEILVVFIIHAHRQNGRDLGLYRAFVPAMANSTTLVEETLDVEIYDEIDRKEKDVVVIKRSFSGFFGTDLDLILKINKIDTLIISGIATHSCCEATARDARHRNYKVVFLSDGTATYDYLPDVGWGLIPGDDIQRFVLTIMALRNAEVICVEEVLTRLSES